MIYTLTVPGPIPDVAEVRVLEWHVREGQRVEPGELLVELETHKALVEVRAAQRGMLRSIGCGPGVWQVIGQPLAVLSDHADEVVPDTLDGLTTLAVDFEVN
jgi:pyruvate/2-oxoglutarate dehydrogenase complex dihydrolipoamide acyltransferase (E2) component